jgi:hypothetical protein
MTLRAAEVSPENIEEVRSHLSGLAGRARYSERALGGADPAGVALAAPHDVYTLGLDQLAAGVTIDDAQPVAKRFLIMEDDAAIASAEIAPEGGSFQSNEGPFVGATAKAIHDAERDPELADGEYELRVLRLPALYLMAVWLKDEHGDGDVVIPLDPAPEPLEANRRYAPRELLPELERMGARQREFDDTP